MALENYNPQENLSPAPDAELLNVAEFLEGAGHENLSELLESLATLDETEVDKSIVKELEQAFARQIALMPEDSEMLKNALTMINLEFSESTNSQFNSRDDYLVDLKNSPTKYFKRVGTSLEISQPGNSVTHTRIHDFIGPEGVAINISDPEKYGLTHSGTNYSWSLENKTWEDTDGERLKLKRPTETVKLTMEEPTITKEDVYGQVWDAVQPQVDSEGTLRGGFVQMRNHLFMDGTGNNEAAPGERPDPVPRSYYYYGRQFQLNPKALEYTGQTTERHDNIAQLMRMGFVKTAPTAGGGIATMIEAGAPILNDYKFMSNLEKMGILDASYEGVLAMTNDYLDQYGMEESKELSRAMENKGRFDARTEAFHLRHESFISEDSGYTTEGVMADLYDNHVAKVLENGRDYTKALNKLPKPFRDKMIYDDVIPSLQMVSESIPDDYAHSKKDVDIHIKQLQKSMTALLS